MALLYSEIHHKPGTAVNLDCPHTPHRPCFNASACAKQTAEQVRASFPRFDGVCTQCAQRVTLYASLEHYQKGEWADYVPPPPPPDNWDC